MRLNIKLAVLKDIYRIHQDMLKGLDLACAKYCAHCCTTNTTLTSLEASEILRGLKAQGRSLDPASWPSMDESRRFRPELTINGIAALSMKGIDVPEAALASSPGKCPFLKEDACRIYALRPFGCRSMVSKTNCGETGYAEMDDWVLSANTVFMQYIEHVDADGYYGNLMDVCKHLKAGSPRSSPEVIPNQAIAVLMIPPEHRKRLAPIVQALNNININR